MELNEVNAAIYVAKLFASYDCAEYANLSVGEIASNEECEGYDVAFTYGDGLSGVMTVWRETDGTLYGEW